MSWSLAIDLGTSCTSAAVRVENKVLDLEFDGRPVVPSIAAVEHTVKVLVGYEAATFAEQCPERTERLPKRALARRQALRVGGTTIEPVDLVATLFAHVAANARSQHGNSADELERVVLTHPVWWSAASRTALRVGANRAGLFNVELMAESIAAGRGYLADPGRGVRPRRWHVRHRGGAPDRVRLHDRWQPGGNEELGGADFDDRLRELIAERTTATEPDIWHSIWEPTSESQARAQVLLRRELVAAKEHLSIANTAAVYMRGFAGERIVSRDQFEAVIRQLVLRTVRLLRDTITRSGTGRRARGALPDRRREPDPAGADLAPREFPVRMQVADLPKLAVGAWRAG